ncbi:MAG: helix-turn-helix transcriptional regulator [Bacteroidota bacterium]
MEELFARENLPSDHDPYTYHRLNFYVLLVIEKGNCVHRIDFQTCPLKEGECVLITPNQIHAFDPSHSFQGKLIVFTPSFLQKHVGSSTRDLLRLHFDYQPSGTALSYSPHLKQFEALYILFSSKENEFLPQQIAGYLSLFLLGLIQKKGELERPLQDNRSKEHFDTFRRLVSTHFPQSRDASWYAGQMSISYKYLNQVCKETIKLTAKAYIDRFIILEAKRYLVAHAQSIKEISFTLGFEEPTNFIKYFKKRVNLTPTEFRSEYI